MKIEKNGRSYTVAGDLRYITRDICYFPATKIVVVSDTFMDWYDAIASDWDEDTSEQRKAKIFETIQIWDLNDREDAIDAVDELYRLGAQHGVRSIQTQMKAALGLNK